MCNLHVQSLHRHSNQMTLRGLIQKAKLHSRGHNKTSKHDKNLLEKGKWEEKGKSELSQIKPCSYCTLETCCHGSGKGREKEKNLKGPWT